MNPYDKLELNRRNNLEHCNPHISKGNQITNVLQKTKSIRGKLFKKLLPGGID